MKKMKFITLLIITSSILFSQEGNLNFERFQYDASVNWFNQNNVSNVPFFYPQNFTGGRIYFAISEINSGKNDIAVTLNSSYGSLVPYNVINYYRKGTWNSNNGSGGFNSPVNYYIDETYPSNQDWNSISGCVFVQLRDNEPRKDLIVGRNMSNGIWVHLNNSSIGGVHQYISANVLSIEKGKFDNSDNREDIIVKEGNQIRIFKNLGNGNLDPNSFPAFTPANNSFYSFKLKQMNDKDYDAGFWPNNEDDKADLVVLDPGDPSGPKLKVFNNSNSNTFSDAWPPISVDPNAYNLEVADVDADGFNDVIVSVGFWGVKIYKNIQGAFLNPTPYWSYNNVTGNTKTKVADINKDGWNDLVSFEYERIIKLFLNTRTYPAFNTTPDQTISNGHRENPTQMELADIYNTGGLALITSDWMDHEGPMIENSMKVINALNYDPAPQPVVIKSDLYNDGGIYRPRITINDTRKERDFYRFWVGKYNYTTGELTAVAITSNTYIDYSEFVLPVNGASTPPPNRWYSVIQMDNSSKWSPASNKAYFTVSMPTCDDCDGGDNPMLNEKKQLIKEYSITNFPNPFNPATTIHYSLLFAGIVRVTIFNSAGQEIKTLVNEFQNVGNHVVQFDGTNLASGLYFYRVSSGFYTETKRMLLIK